MYIKNSFWGWDDERLVKRKSGKKKLSKNFFLKSSFNHFLISWSFFKVSRFFLILVKINIHSNFVFAIQSLSFWKGSLKKHDFFLQHKLDKIRKKKAVSFLLSLRFLGVPMERHSIFKCTSKKALCFVFCFVYICLKNAIRKLENKHIKRLFTAWELFFHCYYASYLNCVHWWRQTLWVVRVKGKLKYSERNSLNMKVRLES